MDKNPLPFYSNLILQSIFIWDGLSGIHIRENEIPDYEKNGMLGVENIRKQYEMITPAEDKPCGEKLEETLTQAVLLMLLELNRINLWQYEECCRRLGVSQDREGRDGICKG